MFSYLNYKKKQPNYRVYLINIFTKTILLNYICIKPLNILSIFVCIVEIGQSLAMYQRRRRRKNKDNYKQIIDNWEAFIYMKFSYMVHVIIASCLVSLTTWKQSEKEIPVWQF